MKKITIFLMLLTCMLASMPVAAASFKGLLISVMDSESSEPALTPMPSSGFDLMDITTDDGEAVAASLLRMHGYTATTSTDVTSVVMKWRVYTASSTPSAVAWKTLAATAAGSGAWTCSSSVDLLDGLTPGTPYIFEFYAEAKATDGTVAKYDNGGQNYKVKYVRSTTLGSKLDVNFVDGETAGLALQVDGTVRNSTFRRDDFLRAPIDLGVISSLNLASGWVMFDRKNEDVTVSRVAMAYRRFTADEYATYQKLDEKARMGDEESENKLAQYHWRWQSIDLDERELVDDNRIRQSKAGIGAEIFNNAEYTDDRYVVEVRYEVQYGNDGDDIELGDNIPIAFTFSRASTSQLSITADPTHYTWTGEDATANLRYTLQAIDSDPANGLRLTLDRIDNTRIAYVTSDMMKDANFWTAYYNSTVKGALGTTVSLKRNLRQLYVNNVVMHENLFNEYAGLDTVAINMKMESFSEFYLPQGCFNYCTGLSAMSINVDGHEGRWYGIKENFFYAKKAFRVYISSNIYNMVAIAKREGNAQFVIVYTPTGVFAVQSDEANLTWTGTNAANNVAYTLKAVGGSTSNGFVLTLAPIDASKPAIMPSLAEDDETSWSACYGRWSIVNNGYNADIQNMPLRLVVDNVRLNPSQFQTYYKLDSVTIKASEGYGIPSGCFAQCTELKYMMVDALKVIVGSNALYDVNRNFTAYVQDAESYQNFYNATNGRYTIVYNHITVEADDANLTWVGTDFDANVRYTLKAIDASAANGFELTLDPVDASKVAVVQSATVNDTNSWANYLERAMKRVSGTTIDGAKAIRQLLVNNVVFEVSLSQYSGLDSVTFNCADDYSSPSSLFGESSGPRAVRIMGNAPGVFYGSSSVPCTVWYDRFANFSSHVYYYSGETNKARYRGYIYVRGYDTGWAALPQWEMTQTDNGYFELDLIARGVLLTDSFKIADDTWSEVNYGSPDRDFFGSTPYNVDWSLSRTDYNIPVPSVGEGYMLSKVIFKPGRKWLTFQVVTTDGIKVQQADGSVATAVYDLGGNRLATPRRGINIVRRPDGHTVKVVVK